MDALLLPLCAAFSKGRRLPPAAEKELNRAERVHLLAVRQECKLELWNPLDKIDSGEMDKFGFVGSPRLHHGRGLGRDLAPQFGTVDEVAEAIDAHEADDEISADLFARKLLGAA